MVSYIYMQTNDEGRDLGSGGDSGHEWVIGWAQASSVALLQHTVIRGEGMAALIDYRTGP